MCRVSGSASQALCTVLCLESNGPVPRRHEFGCYMCHHTEFVKVVEPGRAFQLRKEERKEVTSVPAA